VLHRARGEQRIPASSSKPDPEEGGISIAREGAGAEFLRRRIERPPRIGLYVLLGLGAMTLGTGAIAWLLAPTSLAIGLGALGTVLMTLGYVQHRLYRRDLAHWPDRAVLWDGGIELVLHNGEVRGVSWTDPDLAIDLVARPAPAPAGREFLLVWMTEGKIPSVEITEDAFDRLRGVAVRHELAVTSRRHGRTGTERETVEIRQSPARQLGSPSAIERTEPSPR